MTNDGFDPLQWALEFTLQVGATIAGILIFWFVLL